MTTENAKLGRTLLKALIALKQRKGNPTMEDVGEMFVKLAAGVGPSEEIHKEVMRLLSYIDDAKKEIFAISVNGKAQPAFSDASQHLGESIKAMEEASNIVMDAADAIQKAATGMGGDKEKNIMYATNRIYEACNFQDITGQRITKVIKLLDTIETRIARLNGLFGVVPPEAPAKGGGVVLPADDKDLLHGPPLKGQGASQAEIDALLASLGGKA